jgi:DNA-binding PadR family transcriptional regulator
MNSTKRTNRRLPARREPAGAQARELTDLEACVLGVIWRDGPCTAYAVRKELAESTTPRWSDSAGSIYPVISRLEARGLVEAKARRWGDRGKKELAATAGGLRALRRWVPDVNAGGACGPTFDPVRTKFCFLAALDAAGKRRFFLDARRETAAVLEGLRAELRSAPAAPDDYEALSLLGSIHELEARLRWLEDMGRREGGRR